MSLTCTNTIFKLSNSLVLSWNASSGDNQKILLGETVVLISIVAA